MNGSASSTKGKIFFTQETSILASHLISVVPDDEGWLLPGVPDLAGEIEDAAHVNKDLGVADDVRNGI